MLYKILKEKKNSIVIASCLLTPAFAGMLRKAMPGQPVYVDALPVFLVVFLGVNLLFFSKKKIDAKFVAPIFGWALFQIAFAFLSIKVEILVGITAIFTRVCPMLMFIIAYNYIDKESDLEDISLFSAILILFMVPFGIYSAIYGNSGLPKMLQPLEALTLTSKDVRIGISSFAGMFSTQWLLGISVLALLYLILVKLFLTKKTINELIWWGIIAALALFLIYLSTRRGAFFGGLAGLIFVFMRIISPFNQKKRSKINRIYILGGASFALVLLFIGMDVIDKYGQKGKISRDKYTNRSDWVFTKKETSPSDRISNVFVPIALQWMEISPFGNYLGYGGPEVRAFNISGYREHLGYVEVGAAQLLAEMGILGALLMPFLVGLLLFRMNEKSKKSRYRNVVLLLMIFMTIVFVLYFTKESLMLANVSICSFLFWAIPGICAALLKMEKNEKKNTIVAENVLIKKHISREKYDY